MKKRFRFPGVRLRNIALRTGLLTGVLLSATFVTWLWVANLMPQYEAYASARNILGGTLIVLWMAVPVFRFWRKPVTTFVSGLTAWTLLTITYLTMEMRFSLLESRMGALQVFMLGAICYTFVAAFNWVFQLCAETRHRHVERTAHHVTSEPRRRTH